MKIIHYCHINIYFYLGEWCSHDNQYIGVTVVYYFTVIDPIDVYYWIIQSRVSFGAFSKETEKTRTRFDVFDHMS